MLSAPNSGERLTKRLLSGLGGDGLPDQQHLFDPRFAYDVHAVSAVEADGLRLADGAVVPFPIHWTAGARPQRLAAVVCGLGARLDDHLRGLFAQRALRKATSLDRLANTALFRLGDWVLERLEKQAGRDGLSLGEPWEPGQDGIPINLAGRVVSLAGGAAAGFSVTSLGMLAPVRSLSMLVPLGRDLAPWDRSQRCLRCPSRERCRREKRTH